MGASKPGWENVPSLVDMPAGFEIFGGVQAFAAEHFRGRQVQADIRGVFTIRVQPLDISPKWRIRHLNDGGKIYNIAAVIPVESPSAGGAMREVDIFVKAIDP
jgi:hypothetical protein